MTCSTGRRTIKRSSSNEWARSATKTFTSLKRKTRRARQSSITFQPNRSWCCVAISDRNYQTIVFKRMGKVGDEDVYIIEKKNEKGTPVIDYVSTKSFLVLRRDSVIASETSGIELPQTETFSDYRNVDGVMIPFKQLST